MEYQKFVRIKLEDERYRSHFGLSANIELAAEEDFVLQREFRIDFVFRKIEQSLPLAGIFSYFRMYNLFEFKSVNDAFDLAQVWKYLGEVFWWLYLKSDEEIPKYAVTLTIMTVRKTRQCAEVPPATRPANRCDKPESRTLPLVGDGDSGASVGYQ